MKFIVSLITFVIALYFVTDYFLVNYLNRKTPTRPEEIVLVQGMAKYLEKSSLITQKVNTNKPTSNQDSDSTGIARYFGSTPTDQYFKNYLIKKMKTNADDLDEQTKLFVELSRYIEVHPKESVECLENAFLSIPQDMKAERAAITPAFIHSSINFIEELTDDQTKKTYVKRFMDSSQDSNVKQALESHFPDLINQKTH